MPSPRSNRTKTDTRMECAQQMVPVLKLLFSGEGLRDEQRPLTGETLLVGRTVDPTTGMALPEDDLASSVHACLVLQEGCVMLRDEGSKNGTFVNGKQVREQLLEDRDVIRIGSSLLAFRMEPGTLPEAAEPDHEALKPLLGRSPEMSAVRYWVEQVAPQMEPVLLLGPTGAGKGQVAQAVHALSGRRGRFTTINVATLTPSLGESELFGHERGAFTDAKARQPGPFREAVGGTLFLDEIGDLAVSLQPMLLRALEKGVIRPVGGQEEPVDVRIIAATNHDLDADITSGRFRRDLRARLKVHELTLPPLCDRREDILLLFSHYLGVERRLTARLCEALLLYPWPENIRELVNLTRHVQTFSKGTKAIDLPAVLGRLQPPKAVTVQAPPERAAPLTTTLEQPLTRHRVHYTKEMIERLMREHGGVIKKVASALGISRRQLKRRIEEWGIAPRKAPKKEK